MTKIEKLNIAHQYFVKAIDIVKKSVKKTDEIDLYIYRIEKNIVELNKTILKQLKDEQDQETFKRIIKNF